MAFDFALSCSLLSSSFSGYLSIYIILSISLSHFLIYHFSLSLFKKLFDRSPAKSRSDPYIKKSSPPPTDQSYQSASKPKPTQYPRAKSLDRRGEQQQQQIREAYSNNNNNNKKPFSVSYNNDGFASYSKNNVAPSVTVTKSKSESVLNYRKPSRDVQRG